MPNTDQIQPTDPSEWRSIRKMGVVLTLPSGNNARVRRTLDLKQMLDGGEIPNPLAAALTKIFEDGKVGIPFSDLDEVGQLQTITMINKVVMNATTDPKVVEPPEDVNRLLWEPPEGSISIEDLSLEDRLFIYTFAQGGVASVEAFRNQSEEVLESVSPSAVVGSTTKHSARTGRK